MTETRRERLTRIKRNRFWRKAQRESYWREHVKRYGRSTAITGLLHQRAAELLTDAVAEGLNEHRSRVAAAVLSMSDCLKAWLFLHPPDWTVEPPIRDQEEWERLFPPTEHGHRYNFPELKLDGEA